MALITIAVLLISINLVYCQIDGVALTCNSASIQLTFTERYLISQEIDLTTGRELHFKNNPECFADRIEGGYILTLYPPYTDCGTQVQHTTENYLYSNQVVFATGTNSEVAVLDMQCDYEDKYVVSSDIGLTPYVRTLNFVTQSGNFSVGMDLYQRQDFHPRSKLGPKPFILVGVPIYVSVNIVDVFGDNDIVTTLDTCYANTKPDFQIMTNYHFLITGRCTSPNDTTVRIIQNGESKDAQFSFQMFQWKASTEYIYLHCAVRVCNTSSEVCTGQGPLCEGVDTFNPPLNGFRGKRDVSDHIEEGAPGFITTGPIAVAKLSERGTPEISAPTKYVEKDQQFLLEFIFGGIAILLFLLGSSLIIAMIIVRKRRARRNMQEKEESNSLSSTTDTSSIYRQKHIPVA